MIGGAHDAPACVAASRGIPSASKHSCLARDTSTLEVLNLSSRTSLELSTGRPLKIYIAVCPLTTKFISQFF